MKYLQIYQANVYKKLKHRSIAFIWVPGLYGASGATGNFFVMQNYLFKENIYPKIY